MEHIKKIARIVTLAATLGLTGCELPPDQYLEGKVISESGTAVHIVRSEGTWATPESVRFGNMTYVVRVETNQGNYTINVTYGKKSFNGLVAAIEQGTKVRFPTYQNYPRFSSDRIGTLTTDEIQILDK